MGKALSPTHLARDMLLIAATRIVDSALFLSLFAVVIPLSKLVEYLADQSDASAQRIAAAILAATK